MTVPSEFETFCRAFHQDIFILHPKVEDAVRVALMSLDDRQKRSLRDFLVELVSDKFSDEDLRVLWSNSGADFHLRGARQFFGTVLKELVQQKQT
jgi:hypothetical protein